MGQDTLQRSLPVGREAEIQTMKFTWIISTPISVILLRVIKMVRIPEMMASSLNGLTVVDAIPESIMDSPARSESMFCLRDEMSSQYSPMSEDLEDARYCESPMGACSPQSESRPTSPVSPYRYKPIGAFCPSPPSTSQPSNGCNVLPAPSSQPRQRGSDTEGRFPSSPSDICHSGDLSKAALLRSVQMRAQPFCPAAFDSGFTSGLEPMQNVISEARPYSCVKPVDDECESIGRCPSMDSPETEFDQGKFCITLNIVKGKESVDQEPCKIGMQKTSQSLGI